MKKIVENMLDCMHDLCNKLSTIQVTLAVIKQNRCKECKCISLLENINDAGVTMHKMISASREMISSENKNLYFLECIYDSFQPGNVVHDELQKLGKSLDMTIEIITR